MDKRYKVIGKMACGDVVPIASDLDIVAAEETKKKYSVFSSFTDIQVKEDVERTGENIFSQHKFYI